MTKAKTTKREYEDEEDSLGSQIFSKYLPYWPMFLLAAVIGAGIGFVYLRYTLRVYEANARIIIKDQKKGNEDSKLMESLDLISSKKIVENEIEILQSRSLMLNVVNPLFLYAPVFQKGRVNTVSAYSKSPVLIQALTPDSIVEVEEVYFSYNTPDQTVTLNNRSKYPINQFVSTPYGTLKFVPNKYYSPHKQEEDKEKKQLFFSLSRPDDVAQDLLANLSVEPSSKLSSVIELSYNDPVPIRAENILNRLISSYGEFGMKEKNKLAGNTLSFVEDRLAILAQDLDSIERKVQQYKSGNGAVDISTQGQLFLRNVSANDQKLGELNMQLSVLNQVQKFVADKDNNAAIVPSTLGVRDPMLASLLDKLYTQELEYEKLKKTVGENNPALVAVRDQIEKIKPSISQNIQSEQQSLTAARQNLYSTNGNYNAILQKVPQKERQLLDISREQATKSNIYSFLLQKREESQLSYASAVADHMIVDNAKAGKDPISPKKMIILVISIAACLGLCFAIITMKESFTGRVLFRREVESRTDIPIIGEIAFDKSKKALVIEAGKRSFVAEEFRKLRISLSFLGIDASHKKILVTSSISGEGKSFIAANLAVSLALTGKKVVIVDLDLNNPTLSEIFNVKQEHGITEFLLNQKEPHEIVKRVNDQENLFFISSGSLPADPTELLSNGRVENIINYLDNIFDVVIIDTSPIVLVTDAYILSRLCDATLYVVRHKYTPKVLIKRIDENNEINPIKNPAIIFNGVKMRGFFKNNYGYGYDYVYGNKERIKREKISAGD
ncbi:MAG: polysaccharide biosynthesis tyrosine autokinase [Candidatus Paceibacterota bacterium]